jgi:hypothetical protein
MKQRIKNAIEAFGILALCTGNHEPLIHLSEIMGVTPVNEDTEVHDIIDHLLGVLDKAPDQYLESILDQLNEFQYI